MPHTTLSFSLLMRRSVLALALSSIVLSACGTASGGANGWAAPRATRGANRTVAQAPSVRTEPARRTDGRRAPDARPTPVGSGLVIPVVGIAPGDLRDTFTSPRSGGRVHNAIDIAAPRGTPLVAIVDGTITRKHWNALGGKTLYLRSADGQFDYYYAHLDSYEEGLAIGSVVRRGDRIGTVGSTGNAQGPHLHFQVLDVSGGGRGTPVNPYHVLTAAQVASR